MRKNKFVNKILQNKISLIVIIVLLVMVGVVFIKYMDMKFSLIQYKSIPNIELSYSLHYLPDSKLVYGDIKGFVAFKDLKNQPKNMKQYYVIEALAKLDDNSNQLFSLEEIVSLYPLPPKSIGETELSIENQFGNIITLVDSNGNEFYVDMVSRKVEMRDLGGDSVRLITSSTEYRDFMWDFLK
jgi:hypothetical protein